MADEDIRRYPVDGLGEMAARGESRTNRERLRREPGIELDDAFRRNARVVTPASGNNKSVHLYAWMPTCPTGSGRRAAAISPA